MWIAFVDDSEEKSPSRADLGHVIGIGAALFPEESINAYTEKIGKLRVRLGVPPDVELKWSPDDGSWLKGSEGGNVRTKLRIEMLTIAAELNVRTITVAWSLGRVQWEPQKARSSVLGFMYDKISKCLTSIQDEQRGIIIADEPGGGPVNRKNWLAGTLPLTTNGTEFTKPEQIVLPIVTAPSHHVPQLQLADLVAGATVAAVCGNVWALKLIPYLKKIAQFDSRGRVGGAGLTLWPPELANLYYHLYGDTDRWHRGSVYSLPYEMWDYFDKDAGLPPR